MLFRKDSTSSPIVLHRVRSALRVLLAFGVVLSLSLTGIACDSGGSNGGEEAPEPTAPAAPSGVEATSGNAQVSLGWESVSNAGSYNVYRSTQSTDGVEGDPLEVGHSETSYTDDSVQNGTTYYYRVTAIDSDENEGDASDEVKVTPFDEPPSRPQ